jgi:hypothetical protein
MDTRLMKMEIPSCQLRFLGISNLSSDVKAISLVLLHGASVRAVSLWVAGGWADSLGLLRGASVRAVSLWVAGGWADSLGLLRGVVVMPSYWSFDVRFGLLGNMKPIKMPKPHRGTERPLFSVNADSPSAWLLRWADFGVKIANCNLVAGGKRWRMPLLPIWAAFDGFELCTKTL